MSFLQPEQSANLAQPLLILRGQRTRRGHNFLDQVKGFAARLGIGRKHGRNSSERCPLIDQQHEILLAHERFEF